jgi:hypothetical protein
MKTQNDEHLLMRKDNGLKISVGRAMRMHLVILQLIIDQPYHAKY